MPLKIYILRVRQMTKFPANFPESWFIKTVSVFHHNLQFYCISYLIRYIYFSLHYYSIFSFFFRQMAATFDVSHIPLIQGKIYLIDMINGIYKYLHLMKRICSSLFSIKY